MRTFEPSESSEKTVSENQAHKFQQPAEKENRIETTKAKIEVRTGIDKETIMNAYKEAKKWGQNEEEIIEMFKRFMIGNIGEEIIKKIPINDSYTVYASSKSRQEDYYSQHIGNVSERTGSERKDLLIRDYYIASLQNNEKALDDASKKFGENKKITKNRASAVLSVHRTVLEHYDDQVSKWQQNNNTDRFPKFIELVNWAVNRKILFGRNEKNSIWNNINGQEKKNVLDWSNFLINEQNDLIFHDGSPETNVKAASNLLKAEYDYKSREIAMKRTQDSSMEKQVAHFKSIYENVRNKIKKYADSKYFEVANPDALLVNDSNEETGVLEVKCYSEKEMTRWVETLEYGLRKETGREHFGQEGLQVNTVIDPKNKESPVMVLGFDPDSYANYVEMVRDIRGRNETDFDKTNAPFVLRVLEEIPDELLERLGSVMEHYGYNNFIIQKTKIDEFDIKNIARKAIEREQKNLSEEIPEEILEKLSKLENWN